MWVEMTTCAADGCERPVSSKGWCGMHYMRVRRSGNPNGVRPPGPAEERFKRYFTAGEPDQCWLWTGAHHARGYGHFMVTNTPRVSMYAHRYAYELAYGPIPPGLEVLHACDNPPCVNPAHLSADTHRANMQDMSNKRRCHRHACVHGHEWTPENTMYVTGANGRKHRRCKQCVRDKKAAA